MDLNFDFDPMDVFITSGGDDDDVEDILARQEEAREALEDQMRKAQAMLSVLVKKRDEQVALYREVIEKSQQLGDEVLHKLVAEKADLDSEISLLEQDQSLWEQTRAEAQENGVLTEDLDKERRDICTKLDDLKARRASVVARLYHIENPAFQRLPPEIVQQIFVQCTFSTGKNKRDPEFFGGNDIFIKPNIEKGPLLFTRVCKTWRALALSLPAIWSSIHVSVGTASKRTLSSPPLPVLKEWIGRSGSRPLSFQIAEARDRLAEGRLTNEAQPSQSAGPFSREEQPDLEAMVKLFIPHHARWQSARFMLRNDDNIDLVFQDLPTDARYPALRDLLIARGSWDLIETPISVERVTSMLRNSPALTSFRWGNQRFTTFSQDVPWHQLQVLQLDCIMSMNRFRYVLREAPNLRSLSVHVVFGNPGLIGGSQVEEEDGAEEMQIKLPNLLELAMHYEGRGNDLTAFLNNTTIPHLRSCTLNAETLGAEPQYWPHDDFLSFLRLSGCHLEFLSTHNLIFRNEDQTIELLAALSNSLRHLSIQCDRRCNFMGDKAIRALEVEYALPNFDPTDLSSLAPLCEPVASTSKVLCPRLEYVSFWNCLATTDGTLSDMVASRRRVLRPPGVANLGSVILTLNEGNKHKSDIAVFDTLNEGQWGITYITV